MAFWLFSLAVFRFIGGVAVGAASVIAPTYIAQIAPARIRGRLGSLQQLAIVLGIFLALLADWAIASAAGGSEREWLLGLEAWRWMFLSMTVASVLYGVLALTIPESPRHLVAKGHLDEAREVLRRVLGNIDLDAKVIQIRDTLVHETRPGMRDLRGPALGLLPIVWVGILLSVFQQFVGINVIFYYSSVLWQAVGFNEGDALLITVISIVVNVLTTLVAIAAGRHRHDRPLRPPSAAADRLGRHGGHPGDAGPDLRYRPAQPGGPAAVEWCRRADRAGGRQPVPIRLRHVLGSGRVGHAGREVLQPDPGRRAGRGRGRAVDRQLVDLHHLPCAQRRRARPGYGIYTASAILSFFFVVRFVSETKGKELEEMRV